MSAHQARDEVLARRAAGESLSEISRDMGVTSMRVQQLIRHAKADAYDALVAKGKAPPIGERANGKRTTDGP